jgi:hypothetical protein
MLVAARPLSFYSIRSLILGLVISALAAAISRGDERALIRFTALPLSFLLTALSLVENVLPHWYLGVLTSAVVGGGMALTAGPIVSRRAWLTVAALTGGATFAGSLLLATPQEAQYRIRMELGLQHVFLPDLGMADKALSSRLSDIAAGRGARVMTESYAVGAELEYYGLPIILTGSIDGNSGDEMRKQRDARDIPPAVLFVGFDELKNVADSLCRQAYRDVEPGPVLRYEWGGVPIKPYYTLWCSKANADAPQILYGGSEKQ